MNKSENGIEKQDSYEVYESLVIRRDNLTKDALSYLTGYLCEFGELMNKSFELKISCIEKKKRIAFCQAAVNQGQKINLTEMQSVVAAEMQGYNDQLSQMIDNYNAAAEAGTSSDAEVTRAKAGYRKIAKLIHPDINPGIWEEVPEEVSALWNEAREAYGKNDSFELQNIEVRIRKLFKDNGIKISKPKIDDIEERIAKLEKDISEIVSTPPYTFKELLEDEDLVAERKSELEDEIMSYEEYAAQLDEVLKHYMSKGMTVEWEI